MHRLGRLQAIVDQHGPACRLPELLGYLSRKKRAGQRLDRCGAVFQFDVE